MKTKEPGNRINSISPFSREIPRNETERCSKQPRQQRDSIVRGIHFSIFLYKRRREYIFCSSRLNKVQTGGFKREIPLLLHSLGAFVVLIYIYARGRDDLLKILLTTHTRARSADGHVYGVNNAKIVICVIARVCA